MKGQNFKYPFIVLQLILYISFLFLDIKGGNIALSSYIKFAVVALCFIYVFVTGNESFDRQRLFLCLALFFTLISDIQLLLLDDSDYYFYGVLTFILAQQFHGIRISILGNSRAKLIKDLLIRLLYQTIGSLAIYFLLWKANISINGLLAASIFYFICILTNSLRSLRLALLFKGRKDTKYLAAGMVLFLLCDINVGLFNLSDFLSVGPVYNIIYSVSSILMWTFYAPSQVFISLSGERGKVVV